MISFTVAFAAAFLASSAAAHGGVSSYIIGGQEYPGWEPYNSPTGQSSIERPYSTYDPIMSATAATIHCNDNGAASGGQLTANVTAGSEITAKWKQWTHREGPVMVYMADCGGDCTSANSASLKWFKIDEAGLLSGTVGAGEWGNGIVVDTLEWTSTIPASLAPGNYMIRHELLAIHQANTPQFYPECAQLQVTGGGGSKPSGQYLVSFPGTAGWARILETGGELTSHAGAYSASDPGININIYDASTAALTAYQVPGPAVWSG